MPQESREDRRRRKAAVKAQRRKQGGQAVTQGSFNKRKNSRGNKRKFSRLQGGALFPEDNTLTRNPNRATNRDPVSTRENWNEGTIEGTPGANEILKTDRLPPLPPGSDPYTQYQHRQERKRLKREAMGDKYKANPIADYVDGIVGKAWDQMGPQVKSGWETKGGPGDIIRGIPDMVAGVEARARGGGGLGYQSRSGRRSQAEFESRSRRHKQEQEARFRRYDRKRKRIGGGHTKAPNPRDIVDSAYNEMLGGLFG